MIAGMSPMTPGPAGLLVAFLLFTLSVRLLLWLRRRCQAARTSPVAEVGRVSGVYPVPGTRPSAHRRRHDLDAATLLIARITDTPDATAVLPRIREVSRG